jgi:hypothetical protein
LFQFLVCRRCKPISIVLGLAIGGMPMSSVGLATGGMPVSVGQFGYRCDSCELVAHGYSWKTMVQFHAYYLSRSRCYSLQLNLLLSLSCYKVACHYFSYTC